MPWARQIAVAMTESDEKTFLAFLRTTADIEIFASTAPTREELCLADLPERSTGQTQFFFWNKKFAWEPEYSRNMVGSFYVLDIARAPVIEYKRDPLSYSSNDIGRLYWSKGITPGGPYEFKSAPYAYDATAFAKWYESVVSWVKKNSNSKRWAICPFTTCRAPGAGTDPPLRRISTIRRIK
jgi:hypothetical protein